MPVREASIDLRRRAAMPATDAIGEQVIEAVVAGPDGANRLFTVIGAANLLIQATRLAAYHRDMDFLGGTNSYALAVSSGDRHGFSFFPDRERTNHTAGVHGQCPLRRGRLGR